MFQDSPDFELGTIQVHFRGIEDLIDTDKMKKPDTLTVALNVPNVNGFLSYHPVLFGEYFICCFRFAPFAGEVSEWKIFNWMTGKFFYVCLSLTPLPSLSQSHVTA